MKKIMLNYWVSVARILDNEKPTVLFKYNGAELFSRFSIPFFNKLAKTQISEPDDIYALEKKGNAVYKGVLNLVNYHSGGLLDWNNDGRLDRC